MADQKVTAEQTQKEIDALKSQIADLKAENEKIKKSSVSAGNLQHLVQPHADNLRAAADSMCAAGIGTHRTSGHGAVLRHMAAQMEAEAAQGVMPHIYRDHDFLSASKEGAQENKEISALKEQISSLTSKLTDIEKSKFDAAAEPERKTLSPQIMHLLAKANLTPNPENNDGKLTIAEIDAAFEKTGLTVQQRIEGKLAMQQQGLIKQ